MLYIYMPLGPYLTIDNLPNTVSIRENENSGSHLLTIAASHQSNAHAIENQANNLDTNLVPLAFALEPSVTADFILDVQTTDPPYKGEDAIFVLSKINLQYKTGSPIIAHPLSLIAAGLFYQ